jgi:hypothetical protein
VLVPVKKHLPSNIGSGVTVTINLEQVVPVMPVFFPKLFFLNTATVSTIRVKVKQHFTVGPDDDPLLSANYVSTLLDIVLDPNGDRTSIALDTVAVDGVIDFCTVEITNQGLVSEIVHTWFEGLYEESNLVTPTFPPTIIT